MRKGREGCAGKLARLTFGTWSLPLLLAQTADTVAAGKSEWFRPGTIVQPGPGDEPDAGDGSGVQRRGQSPKPQRIGSSALGPSLVARGTVPRVVLGGPLRTSVGVEGGLAPNLLDWRDSAASPGASQ